MENQPGETAKVLSTSSVTPTLARVMEEHEAQRGNKATSASDRFPFASGVVLGTLVGFSESGNALVQIVDDDNTPLPARSTVHLTSRHVGSEIVLAFAGGDRRQPIILGCLVDRNVPEELPAARLQAELNGERLEITAQEEIVLSCGKSSITLTKAGKVLIRGEYLLSRSAGVNRIKGGSVQIN